MNRPITTLFLLVSADGKISTGDTDVMDTDTDYKKIKGVKEGNKQYYDIELRTDLHTLNSGKVFAKIGMNDKTDEPEKSVVSFIIVDSKPHLNKRGVTYLAKKSKTLYIITANSKHPGFELQKQYPNIRILHYKQKINLADALQKLKKDYGVNRLTIQTGGTMNASWVREGLIDYLSIVIAPVLVGGKTTPTLIDGESLHKQNELFKLKALKLVKVKKLKHSYIHLVYNVISDTVVR